MCFPLFSAVSFSHTAWDRKKPHRMKLFPLIMYHADHSMPNVSHNICFCLLYASTLNWEKKKKLGAKIESHTERRHRCYHRWMSVSHLLAKFGGGGIYLLKTQNLHTENYNVFSCFLCVLSFTVSCSFPEFLRRNCYHYVRSCNDRFDICNKHDTVQYFRITLTFFEKKSSIFDRIDEVK